MDRFNKNEPIKLAVFRSRDLESIIVCSNKEVVPMGYVNSFEEFDGYVMLEYPKAKRMDVISNCGSGHYYYTDGNYNIFYHIMNKLNTI